MAQPSPQPFTRCRLLELPRELRDDIYERVFADNIVTIDCTWAGRKRVPCDQGLVLACRQLHRETVALYYERSNFHASNIYSTLEWLSALSPKHVKHVKKIRCVLGEGRRRFWYGEHGCHAAKIIVARIEACHKKLCREAFSQPSLEPCAPKIQIISPIGEQLLDSSHNG
ncbi:unnamed protein product [Zymoseptoria tritici ST99CH_1E4]|uniref:F-box domain-containing protein n=1 Tax=Zymoseptoria tritici ST99CH_1E4 TaxID=1276532 RepID=A0A2H1GY87_ZYMTR|nr:unnamed protein product [Zymoseptoria tritici ST99CH_1E4]